MGSWSPTPPRTGSRRAPPPPRTLALPRAEPQARRRRAPHLAGAAATALLQACVCTSTREVPDAMRDRAAPGSAPAPRQLWKLLHRRHDPARDAPDPYPAGASPPRPSAAARAGREAVEAHAAAQRGVPELERAAGAPLCAARRRAHPETHAPSRRHATDARRTLQTPPRPGTRARSAGRGVHSSGK